MAFIKIGVKSFSVPKHVSLAPIALNRRSPGNMGTVHLSELDAQALSELCDDFRRRVFEEAKKADPKLPQKR